MPDLYLGNFVRNSLTLICIIGATATSCKKDNLKNTSIYKPVFIEDRLKSDANFSAFVQALALTNIVQSIDHDSLYTIFAPTNEAFDNFIKANRYTKITDIPADTLVNILSYHIVRGKWDFVTLRARSNQPQLLISINNKSITVDVTQPDRFKINSVYADIWDLEAANGVIQGIPEVLKY